MTDPLGYRVDVTIGEVDVGQLVLDPTALRPGPGKVTDPRIENHSSYKDPRHAAIRDAAGRNLTAPPGNGESRY
jgi:hypothetical protein